MLHHRRPFPKGSPHRMNILLLGSGGREHALAWKLGRARSPTGFIARPAMPASRSEAECVALDIADHAAVIALLQGKQDRFRRGRAGGAALVAGIVDDLEAAGIKTFGPTQMRRRGWKAPRASPRTCAAPTTSRPPPMSASRAPRRPRTMCARRARRSWSRPTGLPPAKAWSWPRAWRRRKPPST